LIVTSSVKIVTQFCLIAVLLQLAAECWFLVQQYTTNLCILRQMGSTLSLRIWAIESYLFQRNHHSIVFSGWYPASGDT